MIDAVTDTTSFRRWQMRTLVCSMLGYAAFYLIRKNLSVALPYIESDLGISKSDLGLFLTLHGLLYGISRFVNGFVADRVNARIFMVTGLVLSAIMNFAFGCSSLAVCLGIAWVLNGWTQGMGQPPCIRLLSHWIPPKELATKMSVWNASHSIGASLVVVLCGWLVAFGWRLCFFVPAALALGFAAFTWLAIRDTPSSVGLPELGEREVREKTELKGPEYRALLMKCVFRNPAIWFIALANFFVYLVRYGILDWGPTMLKEHKGLTIVQASWLVAAFEIAGILGTIVAGWASDRFLAGRTPRTCVIGMGLTALSVGAFCLLPSTAPLWLSASLLVLAGFFI
ncbi:MAG: MFS transporter, partial [Kiritimatiellae bacterium]|nr:MFS transporter [Kiritimatiellia bacterium]